ncbi:MAG: MFS transporter [Firmicutes bacterium HGW-Firmicutes-1]|jgi:OFA family oxalate/formate antiporter-like MFS transporter|nr:MAG: MFS transporter [Firmicutes bacterium HGW-Firmicutes-1]
MSEIKIQNNRLNRWVPVIASITIQLCLGTAYIWSVFQTGIATRLFEGDNAAAGLTFAFLLGMLTVGSLVGGKLQDKFSPKPVVMGGGIILGVGFFLSSFTTSSASWMLWVTYGILGGFGMGMIYSTTIACSQKWFPDKRGFITGIIVSALGFGGVVFTPIAEILIKKFGIDGSGNLMPGVGELQTFAWLGVVFIIVCVIGSFFISNPPVGYKPEGWTPPAPKGGLIHQDFTPLEVLRTPQFYMVTLTLMLACMAGLMIIGFAKPIAIAKDLAKVAAVGVMIISIFNSLGRVFWGWASDKIGRKNTIMILLLLTASMILLVNWATGYAVFALIAIVGFSYGGFLGVFPALAADYWGSKNMGTNYGMVLLGFGAGAVASIYIAGYYKNVAIITKVVDGVTITGTDLSKMYPAFIIASIASLLGFVLILFLKPPSIKDVIEIKSLQEVVD